MTAGIKTVSGSEDEVLDGLSTLAHTPNPAYWLSDDAAVTFGTMRKLLLDDAGKLNPAQLVGLTKATNFEDFVARSAKLLEKSASNAFTDVEAMKEASQIAAKAKKSGTVVTARTQELADIYDNQLPDYVKTLNDINEGLPGRVKGWTNKVLGTFYFNLVPYYMIVDWEILS